MLFLLFCTALSIYVQSKSLSKLESKDTDVPIEFNTDSNSMAVPRVFPGNISPILTGLI